MLAEAVLAGYGSKPRRKVTVGLTVTGLSPCEYETYINYKKLDLSKYGALELMRMEDGHSQEAECLRCIWKAGFKTWYTLSNQLTVMVGKADILGHPDGLIGVGGRVDLLEIKAMSLDRFTHFTQKGLDRFPRIRTQVQGYMESGKLEDQGVSGTWVYAKHKDSCRPHDVYEEKNPDFIRPIIEVADAIILEGYVPGKVKSDYCAGCYHSTFCWGEILLDLSRIKETSLPEAVRKWKEGKWHRAYGSIMNEEARAVFEEELGEDDLLLVEDLRVKKIHASRTEIDIEKFVELFGAHRLPEVMVERPYEQVRISEVGGEEGD